MKKTLYTVRRITKENKFIGPVHASDDANKTICENDIDEHWYILTNDINDKSAIVTCPKCIKRLTNNS